MQHRLLVFGFVIVLICGFSGFFGMHWWTVHLSCWNFTISNAGYGTEN